MCVCERACVLRVCVFIDRQNSDIHGVQNSLKPTHMGIGKNFTGKSSLNRESLQTLVYM